MIYPNSETADRILNGYSYHEYRKYLNTVVDNNELKAGERMLVTENIVKFKKADRYAVVDDDARLIIKKYYEEMIWMILTDVTCDDSAKIIPIISKLSSVNELIEIKIILIRYNPDIMNLYLTNGARAIPKVVCYRKNDFKELWNWGPRPAEAQKILKKHKNSSNWNADKFHTELHKWYDENKGKAIISELTVLIQQS